MPLLKFTAASRLDLDGTHKCHLYTNYSLLHELSDKTGGALVYLKVACGERACGALLPAKLTYSPQNRIEIDSFKLKSIDCKDGAEVIVEPITPQEALVVKLRASAALTTTEMQRLHSKPFVGGETSVVFAASARVKSLRVLATEPDGIVCVTPATQMEFVQSDAADLGVRYADIGGLDRELKQIRELAENPFRYPALFQQAGIAAPRGIVLHGPPGTGKSLIARALAAEVGAKIFTISGPEIYSKWYGDSEKRLRDIFKDAQEQAPSIVLIDELDALVPRRETSRGDLEHRIVNTMLTIMDGLHGLQGVMVIGTTNRIDDIDPALRREGRFSSEVRIGVPDLTGRRQILAIYLARMPLADDVDIDVIAQRTVGFVGADLVSLCREAAYVAIRRHCAALGDQSWSDVDPSTLRISRADFLAATSIVQPSGLREFTVEIPSVTWEHIGGLDEIKRLLLENVGYPISRPEAFLRTGIAPARGLLLYGPPGTGKTLLAKAVAHECGANFIAIRGPEIRSKWFGESERNIRAIFAKARECAPCVVFFDEIDAIAPVRGRDSVGNTDPIVNQLLTEMDGIQSAVGVFVLAATNRANLLDEALLRPGRFDHQVEVPLPDAGARLAVLNIHLDGKPIAEDVDVDALVIACDGFSGAEIAGACREAGMGALRRACFNAQDVAIGHDDLQAAIERTRQAAKALRRGPIGFGQPD